VKCATSRFSREAKIGDLNAMSIPIRESFVMIVCRYQEKQQQNFLYYKEGK